MTAVPALSAMARAAVTYARSGWHVFPLRPRDKRPLANVDYGLGPDDVGGFTLATNSVAQVTAWWTRWPEANIGCHPGPSGFIILDLDGPEGEAGAQALGLLAEPTLEVVTGRDDGGRHRWYRHPGGHIGNAALAPKLDVRADAGYVVLPPSVHPSGRKYRWLGKLDEIAALPTAIVDRMRQTGIGSQPAGVPARAIPALESIPSGGRNNALASYAGRLLAKGHHVPEATDLCLALNAAKCQPPLPADEVAAIVASVAKREARKPARVTSTGQALTIADAPPPPEAPESFSGMAWRQIEDAVARGQRDFSGAPRWFSSALNERVGPMLPGDLNVVGALTGNGKTSYLMSQMQFAADQQHTTLYLPLEMDPHMLRRQWAAWQLGLEWVHVARNEWQNLRRGARDEHEAMLVAQMKNPHVHFPPDRRVTLRHLADWMRRGVAELNVSQVIVDHFHRMDFGPAGSNFRVVVTDTVRAMKDLARECGVAVIIAAQLNQDADRLDRYIPPSLKRLKESAGIGEEADVVLMLSRRLQQDLTSEQLQSVRLGHTDIRRFEDEGTMTVMCRKHRLDDQARDRAVLLKVEGGKVTDRPPVFEVNRTAWEPN